MHQLPTHFLRHVFFNLSLRTHMGGDQQRYNVKTVPSHVSFNFQPRSESVIFVVWTWNGITLNLIFCQIHNVHTV